MMIYLVSYTTYYSGLPVITHGYFVKLVRDGKGYLAGHLETKVQEEL